MPAQYGWVQYNYPIFSFGSESENSSTIDNCTDGVQWIWIVMKDCVFDTRGILSNIFGIVSIFIWMVVGIPQMVQNCRHIMGMQGISVLLMLQWLFGDSTNLIGSVLTQQLKVQIYLAIYYVCADCILLVQYSAYLICKRRKQKKQIIQATKQGILCLAGMLVLSSPLRLYLSESIHLLPSYTASSPRHLGRTLLSMVDEPNPFFHDTNDIIGYTIGIMSSLFYIGSRVAQIVKNYRRKSTDGLSKLMFFLAIFGNLTYGLAVLIRSVECVYIVRHLPWLVGSLGVIFLDLTLLLQFYKYSTWDFDALVRAPLIINSDEPSIDEEDGFRNPSLVT